MPNRIFQIINETNFERIFLLKIQWISFSGEVNSRVFFKYSVVEQQVYLFTKQMKAFVSFTSTICLLLPCIYAGFRAIIGKYSGINDWYLPYKFK